MMYEWALSTSYTVNGRLSIEDLYATIIIFWVYAHSMSAKKYFALLPHIMATAPEIIISKSVLLKQMTYPELGHTIPWTKFLMTAFSSVRETSLILYKQTYSYIIFFTVIVIPYYYIFCINKSIQYLFNMHIHSIKHKADIFYYQTSYTSYAAWNILV